MVALADVITHGCNAVRYSVDKEKSEVVMVHCLPENITPSSMWDRMLILQQKYREKINRYNHLYKTAIRIEVSPAKEETENWTMADWQKLADDFIREFDAQVYLKNDGRKENGHTNLANSQYVVSLHRDSKGQILHLHINANRIDMEGNTNNSYMIRKRAMAAANKINEQRGWIQSMKKRDWNINEVTNACIDALKMMDSFDWNTYEAKLKAKGYGVNVKRSNDGKVVGYVVKKGNSFYKSTLLGHSRSLTPSRIMNTWAKLHQDKSVHTQTIASKSMRTVSRPVAPVKVNTQQLKPQLPTRDEPLPIIKPEQNTPEMVHHDIEWNGRIHPVDIPIEADKALLDELGTMEVDLCATIVDAQKTAFLLFANYLDAATEIAESCGGGASPESNWGRKDDEDDIEWARHCARQARQMHQRPIRRSRGL